MGSGWRQPEVSREGHGHYFVVILLPRLLEFNGFTAKMDGDIKMTKINWKQEQKTVRSE